MCQRSQFPRAEAEVLARRRSGFAGGNRLQFAIGDALVLVGGALVGLSRRPARRRPGQARAASHTRTWRRSITVLAPSRDSIVSR
jgi:hypothetical protein